MKSNRKRQDLIHVGRDLIVRQGFNATGLSDILATAGVPKGSFYYYFESKDDFGLAIIDDFANEYQRKLDASFLHCTGCASTLSWAFRIWRHTSMRQAA